MTINFAELRELHQRAMSGGPKSNAFALFSATMYQQFETIYTTAKALQDDIDALRDAACRPTLKHGIQVMEIEAEDFTLPDSDPVAEALEASQAGHVFVGLDFLPVEEGLPDDNALVFMLLSPSEDEPMLLGYHEAGFWFFADGMVVGSPYTVTHWTDMPEVNHES